MIRRERDGVMFAACVDSLEDQEFLEWIAAGNTLLPYAPPAVDPKEQAKAELAATDKDLARVAEDLIGALIGKGVIAESDIPQPARSKLARRAELRSKLA